MTKPSPDELRTALSGVRALLEIFEEKNLQKDDPRLVAGTLAKLIGVLKAHGKPPAPKKKLRGLGLSFDDAIVVAHLQDFGGNMTAALKVHYPKADDDEVAVHARRIREHMKAIEDAGVPDRVGNLIDE